MILKDIENALQYGHIVALTEDENGTIAVHTHESAREARDRWMSNEEEHAPSVLFFRGKVVDIAPGAAQSI